MSPILRSSRSRSPSNSRARAYPSVSVCSIAVRRGVVGSAPRCSSRVRMRWTREAKSWLIGMSDYREARPRLHGPGGPSSVRRRPRAGSRISAVLASLAAALVLAAPSGAGLWDALSRALVTPGVSSSATGAFAFDLSRSSIAYRQNQLVPYRPASNEKLTVAVTALDRLGPGCRIPTDVLGVGTLDAGVWQGRLILKGYGDPALTRRRLAGLAAQVRAAGIAKVTGRILGDESYFDSVRVGPGWKPSYYKDESPPLSALVGGRAVVQGRPQSGGRRRARNGRQGPRRHRRRPHRAQPLPASEQARGANGSRQRQLL